MILRHSESPVRELPNCHEGTGMVRCRELLADYSRTVPGFKFIHDNVIEPGATIGEHVHRGEEELYIVLEGSGRMIVDGEQVPVGPGDACLTRDGHSHGMINGDEPMRMLVICTQQP